MDPDDLKFSLTSRILQFRFCLHNVGTMFAKSEPSPLDNQSRIQLVRME